MSDEIQNNCPTCGELIPENAPQGLCPKCVLGAAAAPTDSGSATIPFPRFEAPDLAEISEAFPQLEILELIGCGGMGAVYRARQPHLDRDVALKILPHSLAETAEFAERFSREGRLLARLSHPNIVGVYDFGESGGYFFLLMEFVDGVNLRQAMHAGRFTPNQALDVVPKVCEALQFAHDEGILHRDIKPENILMDTKGRVKIADFGIAKMVGDVGSPTLTRTGSPGTPQYMAPEQIEHPTEVDHRADIYSLGVVFYEMLTGELPIGRFAPPSEKADVGSDIDDIVFRSLEKERDRRQQSANEVRTEISSVPHLSDVPHPGFRGVSAAATHSDDPKNRPALALTLTFFGIVFPIILLFASVAMANHSRMRSAARIQSENTVSARTSEMTHLLKNDLALVVRQGAPLDEIEKIKQNLDIVQRQDERLKNRRKNSVVMDEIKFLPLLISAFVILPLCIIPGTVFGWMQLRRQRILGLKSGRAALIVAAWFWPMLFIFVFVSVAIIIPALLWPFWIRQLGTAFGLIGAIGLAIWLIRRTLIWLDTPVPATDRANFVDMERKRSAKQPLKQRRLLYFFTLGSAISLTLLIVAGIIGESIYRARGGESDGSLISAIIVVVIILVIFSTAFFLLINRTYLPKKALPHPNYNPWPKRVFWLVLVIFVGPTLLVGISFLVPALAFQSQGISTRISADHAVSVRNITTSGRRVLVVFEFVNQTHEILEADVIFQGSPMTEQPELPNGLKPTETRRVEVLPGKTEIEVAFDFPNPETTRIASSEIQRLINRQIYFEDLSVLPLFRIESKPEDYRAVIHFLPAE